MPLGSTSTITGSGWPAEPIWTLLPFSGSLGGNSPNATNALVTDSDTATGTITDNDDAKVTVEDVSVAEGGGLLFTVTLDNAVQGAFDVNVSLADISTAGGATTLVTPEDYDNGPVTLNFAGNAG